MGAGGWSPILAQNSYTITADARLVSDYRFRGISASSRGPAVQTSVDIITGAVVAGVWASSTSDYHGSYVETDWYAGGKYSYGKTDFVLVGYAFIYPGSKQTTTFDIEASIVAPLGNLKTSSLVAFAPGQTNSPKPNVYLSETLSFPFRRDWTMIGHYGFETGNYDNKQDWKVGVRREGSVLGLELGLVGSNYRSRAGPDAGTGLVGSVAIHF